MANTFNLFEETQFSVAAEAKRQMTNRERLMMEALLEDSGFFVAAPAPTPTPQPTPSPAPAPAPAAAPAPTPAPAPASTTTINAIVRLAMTTVKPGDLITADFANNLVEALIALDRRITTLEEAMGKATPTPSTATPTPAAPAPTPTTSRSAPVIDKVDTFTIVGRGVAVTVTGDNIGEGLVERVLLGTTSIALSDIKFERGGFSFLTTTAVIRKAKDRLTVVTSGGEDSAPLTAATTRTPPVQ